MSRRARQGQAGLGALAALLVLVGLSLLAAALLRLGTAAQTGASQDFQAAQASQAARAGAEWGLYQALKGSWSACSGASQTLDLSASHGMWVTVSCSMSLFNEGESAPGVPLVVHAYAIDAVACNSSAGCPDAARAVQPHYVERRRLVQATQ